MAEAVVSFVLQSVRDFTTQEAKFLCGVSQQVEVAQTELQLMQSFLKDADRRQVDDASVRIWVAKIRDAAYDLEDVIQTYGLKVATKNKGGMKNVLKRFGSIFKQWVDLHKIGAEIENITFKISNLRSSLQSYNIIRETKEIGGASSLQSFERQQQLRRTYSHVIERVVVGIKDNVKEIVTYLVKEENCLRVVSIWGMGGSGKTTLAKQIYHHEEVRCHFKSFAWVCISQQYQVRDVWEGILIKLISATKEQREEIAKMRDYEIAKKLFLVQRERRCLVILDDIWSIETFNSLKAAFPLYEETQSRVLLTTRNEAVALHVDRNGFLHQPQALKENDSWELFEKIAISGRIGEDSGVYKKMKELGIEMLRHCAGLPLAIIVLAGVLARKNNVKEWETVHENVHEYIRRGKFYEQEYEGASWVLALSYDDLPYHLKPCFLYLGHYPEDHEISVSALTKLWVAEGLISLRPQIHGFGETMEDIARKCLSELVERCVVQVGRNGSTGTIKTCRIHDLIRDLCLIKAEEESFLQIGHSLHENESTSMFTSSMVAKATPLGKVRRLAIYLDENADRLVSSRGETSGHLRSLLYYDLREWRPTSKKLLLSPLTGFKVLRVLKLEGVNEKVEVVELPSEIGNMVHLRFLSVRSSNINTFPSSLGNLICLQTLDFRVKNDLNIPNVIWKMKELRHLYLPMFYRASVELKLSTLGHLQTLDFLSSKYCDLKDVIGLTNIRKLNIRLSSSFENLDEILKSTGSTLNRIRSLFVDIDYARKSSYEEQIRQIVSICPRIYKLKLFGPTPELPKELCNYANLTKLELRSCGLKDDQMGILEKLPHLTTLRLQGRNTFEENTKILVFSKGGFLCLEFLSVFDIPEITEWRVEEGAMPSLCRLRIGFPCGLTALPDGLRYLTNLRKLSIFGMLREFHSRIQEDGEDFSKIQHVPSLVIGEPYDPPIQ
ncbi:PREDICTED: putative disease resistance protein At1g50180 [Prunus mume]|uniref:Disease resistance protein At1g50180 n=1 Tax=Prunus mume TaxID=102107 RepID=A0ABM0NGI4_PRUMU|nr:PREDICTED: putative disease resistance protein At1g50180 [Prunus mume]